MVDLNSSNILSNSTPIIGLESFEFSANFQNLKFHFCFLLLFHFFILVLLVGLSMSPPVEAVGTVGMRISRGPTGGCGIMESLISVELNP